MPDKRLKDALKAPATTQTIQRGTPYQVGRTPPAQEPELPAQASALRAPLQEIARSYIGARKRSGEALLDAARWLTEARELAEHGEWQLFLDATSTSSDTAERLLNIHARALENPQFADAIARNWLGQSTAALLARPSTPPEVIDEVLQSDEAPTKVSVEQRLKAGKPHPAPVRDVPPTQPAQIPHSAEFDAPSISPPPVSAAQSPRIRADLIETLTRIALKEQRDINAVLEDAIKVYLTPR